MRPSTGRYETRALAALSLSLTLSACGGAPPPAVKEPAPVSTAERESASSGPTFESEIGALDENKVNAAFKKAADGLGACFDKGAERVPYLAGDVRFMLRIAKNGSVRWAYVKDSNLGDRETEECMLGVLKAASWPRPQGGEGLAENTFNFRPGGDERPPVAWTPEQLGKPFKGAKSALSQCRKKAGTGALKATLYVDTDGKAKAVGVASADEKGEAAVSCVIGALQSITFPSPGSYASKVSVTIE